MREGHVDVKISDPVQVQAWLANHGVETNYVLPVVLGQLPTTGCRVLDWHGNKISMICYMLDGSRHFDLFVAAKSDFSFPPPSRPYFRKIKDLTTAIWTKNDKVYLMVGRSGEVLFRRDLEPEKVVQTEMEAESHSRFGTLPHPGRVVSVALHSSSSSGHEME